MTITEQEYFDRVCERLRDGTGPAIHTHGAFRLCVYLTPHCLKCAVGIFIPDEHPAQHYVGGVLSLAETFPDLKGVAWPATRDGLELAEVLQQTHDAPPHWDGTAFTAERELEAIAQQFGLVYTNNSESAIRKD